MSILNFQRQTCAVEQKKHWSYLRNALISAAFAMELEHHMSFHQMQRGLKSGMSSVVGGFN